MANYLKKAVLTNSGVWKTTILWESLLTGETQIVFKQSYKLNKKNSYTRTEKFATYEFYHAYDRFHQLLKEWI